jgi:hypothetical protein
MVLAFIRLPLSTVAAICTLIAGSAILQPKVAAAIEQPKYTVIETHRYDGSSIEFRNYASYIVAETTVEAQDFDEASSEGFRRLAAYIFGENNGNVEMDMTAPVETRSPEKMDMTAPVSTVGEPGAWNVRFVMPSKYTLETLPTPDDARISILEIPARTVAAISFSGRWTIANFDEHTARLQSFLVRKGIKQASGPAVARYNMPLTPWFLRTNEIQIDIER